APRVIIDLANENNIEQNDEQSSDNSGDTSHHKIDKRATTADRQIETAVFVDDAMYNVIKDRNPSLDVIKTITDLVLTIMNAAYMYTCDRCGLPAGTPDVQLTLTGHTS
ncbi:hypothetical protein OTU49_003010, partial [Cherax quadricarinatus]